ncbi:hypothetical protein ALC57_10322 [Trachymyrmex cornetzi]|uniref:Uncharacterized protein n=1 Tax=Trachymyrmex cornetzi TaxID=471704 RepID=A0A195DWY3_9HYME|nr:hypothetical protein ALC57_10322 [Trachymyrmex cornetzi]
MALAYCLRSCRLPTSASGVDHVGSSAYQLTTLQPFSSEHRNLIDTYEVLSGSPRGVFCATPFSGSATRCPTEICTKEETTQAGGPICKARSVFWPPRILMYSQNTCNSGFFINKVLGLHGRRQISLGQVTFVITSSHGSPSSNFGLGGGGGGDGDGGSDDDPPQVSGEAATPLDDVTSDTDAMRPRWPRIVKRSRANSSGDRGLIWGCLCFLIASKSSYDLRSSQLTYQTTVWSQREINTIYMDIPSLTHGISRNPPHANAGDPSEIIREGAGSDARSIDLKVVPCTPHYATNILAFRYEPHAKASLNMALVNPVCRFTQVSLSLLDVIFNFNWPGRRKIRILAHGTHMLTLCNGTNSDITRGSFL